MSATPTRFDWQTPDPGFAVGNRVLESIGRQESLHSLLAFSDLHEQIRNRREAEDQASDWVQTERFVLDEVLQLICQRTQAIAQADCIMVALAAGQQMICRATAGPLPIPRGSTLEADSAFLQECLNSGKILRCDDSETDPRVTFDLSRLIGARSTVLVPLRGQHQNLGVLQAFSLAPWAFTESDIRCLDLFAELVLAALKPEDQNRRFHWLADVANDVLQATPPSETILASLPAETGAVPSSAVAAEQPALAQLEPTGIEPPAPSPVTPIANEPPRLPDLDALTQPVVIPAADVEVSDLMFADIDLVAPTLTATAQPESESPLPCPDELLDTSSLPQIDAPLFGANLPEAPFTSRPGLTAVMALVAVAALFSAGVWWGMQYHSKAMPTKTAAAPRSVTTPAPPAPEVLSSAADNLMAPPQANSGESPLTAVPADKLAALPKITGVRHWSSSMGSTVVIDMEDQVPYEVHRLTSPERIYFDLHDTALTSDLDGKTMDVGDASLMRVRVAQPVSGVTRVVLDTKDGSNFSVSLESNPYRLVVELKDATKLAETNRLLHPAPAPVKPATTAALAANSLQQPVPARTGKFRIVLDAGHGGWDLGTVGRQGLLEKDLVLDVTRRLGKLLQSRLGSEVLYTRTGDDYLPLDQRADFANQAEADLFVSVHANYSSLASARGVETYYSRMFSAPGSSEIGSRELEQHGDGTTAHVTPASLSAGGLREKIDESRRLASSVQRALFATLSTKSPDIRDRGIKDAGFVVLTGTTMPAILTEISFVSSPADEHNLQSEAYRQQIAEALYKGIARYQESSPRAKVAQLHPAATGR